MIRTRTISIKLVFSAAAKGLILVAVLVFLGKLITLNHLSSSGSELRELEIRRDQLIEQNAILKKEIASEASLSRIEVEANKLGLKRATSFEYLTSLQVASR